jgi:hypothetical protein
MPHARWRREFEEAPVRIVTGSRTLLEALEWGGPFLYFNGIIGSRVPHRHRPEKIRALLELGRRAKVARSLRRDLADFSRGRRVREVVARAGRGVGAWRRFPPFHRVAPAFSPPYDDAGALVVAVARTLARRPDGAVGIVREVRSGTLGAPPYGPRRDGSTPGAPASRGHEGVE